jgi:hypothetical protein
VKEANTFFFWFDEDDDNLRFHSLITELDAAVIYNEAVEKLLSF